MPLLLLLLPGGNTRSLVCTGELTGDTCWLFDDIDNKEDVDDEEDEADDEDDDKYELAWICSCNWSF